MLSYFSHGELGSGSLEFLKTPRLIEFFPENDIKIMDICTGAWHNLALTESGDAYVWGWNRGNALGLNCDEVRLQSNFFYCIFLWFNIFQVNVQPFPFPVETNSDLKVVSIFCHNSSTLLELGKFFQIY